MEDVAAKRIHFPKSPHKIITRVLPVVVVEPTITGALVGINTYGIKVQATIWALVTIDNPPIEFKWRWLIGLLCFPSWT